METIENIIGIYRIIHNGSGRFYLGSSKQIKKRFQGHKSMLNNGSHHSKYLQSVWSKYGETAFSFEIIDTYKTWDEALDSEQELLDKFFKTELCMNMSGQARMPILDAEVQRRARITANSSQVYIDSHRNVCIKRNSDPAFQAKATERLRNSVKHKESVRKNAILLQRPEIVAKMRESLRNSEKFKASSIRQALFLVNDPIIRAKNLLATSRPVIGKCIKTGEIVSFPSQSSAARWLGVYSSSISECCLKKQAYSKGYTWEYAFSRPISNITITETSNQTSQLLRGAIK